MNPASLAVEAAKVVKGKESGSNLLLYLGVAVTVEAVFKHKESETMLAPIYMPEGYELPIFIILIAGAILMPVIIGMWFKNESKNAGAKWTGRYVATVFIDMFIAPSLGLILMSLITQEFFPDMDPLTYMVILPIVMAAVAYYGLRLMNEGIKGVTEQIVKNANDAKGAVEELKKL